MNGNDNGNGNGNGNDQHIDVGQRALILLVDR